MSHTILYKCHTQNNILKETKQAYYTHCKDKVFLLNFLLKDTKMKEVTSSTGVLPVEEDWYHYTVNRVYCHCAN